MTSTKLKLFIVALGLLWCGLLVYILSSSKSGDRQWRGIFSAEDNQVRKAEDLGSKNFLVEKVGGIKVTELKPFLKESDLFDSLHGINGSHSIIQVVLSASERNLIGLPAAIHSIVSHTKSAVYFYITLPRKIILHFKDWIANSPLRKVQYQVQPHPASIPMDKPHFAMLYIPIIFADLAGPFVYMEPDVIVQGDVSELTNLPIDNGFIVAPDKCTSVGKRSQIANPSYSFCINMQHPHIMKLGINPAKCTFSSGIFISNATEWHLNNISFRLSSWVAEDKRSTIVGIDPGCDAALVSMLVVFYNKSSPLPPMWHVGQLGMQRGAGYSSQFISKAKGLQWNGHLKPWSKKAAFSSVWKKYYIPDPRGVYLPSWKM